MIPCNCLECIKGEKTHFYDYATIIKFRQEGIKEIPCSLSAEYVSTEKLLDGIERKESDKEEEILQILRKLQEKSDTEETLLRKANEVITVNPSIMGVSININKLIEKLFKKQKKS